MEAQLARCVSPFNYLKAASIALGLPMNFGNKSTFKQLVYNEQQKESVKSVLICG
jgi:hypothetical protein